MMLIESSKGKTIIAEKEQDLRKVTSNLATVFGMNQVKLRTIDGQKQTLYFNRKNFSILELAPVHTRGFLKEEYGINRNIR